MPLVVQIGNQISNTVKMPVANGNRTCTFVRSDLASLGAQQIEQAVSAGPISFLAGTLDHSDGGGTFEDDARFQFVKVLAVPGSPPFFVSWADNQPPGTCTVYTNLNASANNPFTVVAAPDADPSVTVTGPKGSVTVPTNTKELMLDMTGEFLVPGTYTVTGTGGSDVGPFSGTIALPQAPTLVSPADNSAATRANGMTVSWTGGSGNLEIEVNSCTDSSCNNGAAAVCQMPASLGSFTIPPYVLEALPASNSAGLVLSSYSYSSFTATGLNAGFLQTYSNVAGFGYGWGSGGFSLK